jgi:hypothetical protein
LERRPFLALLATAVAGCNATSDPGTQTSRPTETPTGTTAPSDTATATPTDTVTSTATDAPTETPTAEERRAREAIAAAESTLGAVIEQYRGDAGETILAADASYAGFADRSVQTNVSEATREIERAREAAVTERQAATVERLATTRRFVAAAAEVQVALRGAYRHLQVARDAFADTDAGAARAAVDEMDTDRRIARGPYRTIVEETTAEATAALPALDASTYRGKREQFDAEMRAFGALRGPLGEFTDGVGKLESALALRRNGSTAQAERTARAAARRLDTASGSLAAFADGLDTPADSLVEPSRSLSDLAAAKASETRDRFELSGADGTTETPESRTRG